MKKFLMGVIVLVVLIAAIIALAPMLVPASAYKGQLESAAKSALGRDVTFGDELSFKLFPQAAFHVSDLQIANADGFDGSHLARVGAADIGVRIMPLFSRKVEINRFVLNEPDLTLIRRADGAVNWNLAGGAPQEDASADNGAIGAQAGGAQQWRDISLGDVRIVNGKATYNDQASGQNFKAEAMNLTVRLDSLDKPLTLDGDLTFQGASAKANIIITTLGGMLRNEQANLKIDLSLADASAGADLAVQTGEALSWRGPISLNAPDLPGLARLFDVALEEAPGFDRLSLDGQATGSADSLSLAGAKIIFDAIDAEGDFKLNWGGVKPKASGALSTGVLDLRPYMPPPSGKTAQGFPAWSEAKMDFTSLRNIDANLDVAAEKILMNGMKINRSRMKLTIANGRMTAEMPEIALYGGAGSGRLVVNARGATPSFSGAFDLSAVNAQPLSLDMLKTDRLLGIGALTLNFTASGNSQAAIMRSIDGDGGFDLADGALKGVNIAKLARTASTLQKGFNPAALTSLITAARGPDEATDFSKFLCQFTMANGLITVPTITLDGPYLTMAGAGNINLPNQTVDLRLNPRASTSTDGKEGRSVAIPLRVSGSFSEPKYGIDAETLVRGRLEDGVRGLIGGALGGRKKDGEQGAEEESAEDPGKALLKGLIGGRQQDGQTPDGETAADEEGSLEEDLANEALDLLFGGGKKQENESEPEPDGKRE